MIIRKRFKWAMGFVTTAATGLSFWHPAANAFVMMFLAVPGNLSLLIIKKFLSVIIFFYYNK